MTGVQAMKEAVEYAYEHCPYVIRSERNAPNFVKKFLLVIYKLNREVFNFQNGNWEYEGF